MLHKGDLFVDIMKMVKILLSSYQNYCIQIYIYLIIIAGS
jgi:hypothetical protein